jgi:hypothetical protein
MPYGVCHDSPNPLSVLLALEWNQDTVLGPGSSTLSAPSQAALLMWDHLCQGHATFRLNDVRVFIPATTLTRIQQ